MIGRTEQLLIEPQAALKKSYAAQACSYQKGQKCRWRPRRGWKSNNAEDCW